MSEEKNGDMFFIVFIIIVIIVFATFGFSKLAITISKIIGWVVGIILALAILSFLFYIFISKKKRISLTTNANLPINSDQTSNDTLIAILEVTSLPAWADISGEDYHNKGLEAAQQQLSATENFIRNCMNAMLPFGMALLYTEERNKILFWTSALSGSRTNEGLLEDRITQLRDFFETSFPDARTKVSFTNNNPICNIINNDSNHVTTLQATEISGEYFIADGSIHPFLNEFNIFMQRINEKGEKKRALLCFTCYPEKQEGIHHYISKKLANRKYKSLSQQVQQSYTNDRLFSSSKVSTSQTSLIHNEQLQKQAIEYEKLKAPIINHVGAALFCVGSGKTEEQANSEASKYLTRAKGTLSRIVDPNNENSFRFKDIPNNKILENLQKLFFVDSYLLPNTSRCLSSELALLMRMPNKDTGLRITREDKSYKPMLIPRGKTSFPVGKLLEPEGTSSSEVFWSYDGLRKHTFITGATGAGKTYSIANIIQQAEQASIPSIIFDLGKGELFPFLQQGIPDLRVFTIGNDSVCPIRLNPMECPEWTNPQQHFDNFKSILDASLPQFEPLPLVVYRALSRLYNSDGWDCATGTRGKTRTLKDLLEKGIAICDEVGYSDEVYSNMKGAFSMRIGSLMEGSLGRQLYTKKSIPIPLLLERSIVLEFQTIDGTAQKITVLTLLTQIFDYFKTLGPTADEKPRCLLVLDEAETIFAAAEVYGNDVEMVTAAYNAVKKLNQILRQGRAFGLAVIIATQSPSNVSHEIIANTEYKIIHRTHHGLEKRTVQEALELTNSQTAKLSSLKPGECYAVDGENEFPYIMSINKVPFAGMPLSQQQKEELMKEQMEGFYRQYPWLREIYVECSEQEFDKLFDNAITSVKESMKLNHYTNKRIRMLLQKGTFQEQVKERVKQFLEGTISERTFYEELLEILYETSIKVIGSNKDLLREASMELFASALKECSFLDSRKRSDILETIRDLIFIDRGR
ncbi:MAG: ATP-binding protein [Candidatus Heimdallarchaeota archaeon]